MIVVLFLTNKILQIKRCLTFGYYIRLKVETKELFIDAGVKTPQIDLNPYTGELIFSGRSIPENASSLYEKVYNWIHDYAKKPKLTTNLRLNLEYFNSASSIWLAKIIKTLCSVKKSGFTLFIHLYFDIEDFDSMNQEDLKDALSPIMDMIGTPSISIGIKIYGTDKEGKILKEGIVLI
ncbi:MAG TPA: SiaC family regulatory phosphoprotein [Bacteroidales bacterium]|nr:SiaC family regulatory phosphoprotein [Bacteroidales bacterium]